MFRTKKIMFLILGILSFSLLRSQENYLPGYVIDLKGDTLYGFIDYRNWRKNPKMINYKAAGENNPTFLNPIEIIEFKVQDEIYVSGIINVEISPVATEELNEDPNLQIETDTVFLQTLVGGKKPLYYYNNRSGRENFYIKQDTIFELLIYKRYIKQKENKRILTENRKYLGQLSLYLGDCPSIQSKLETTSYKQNSLIKLFQYYYEYFKSDIPFQKKTEKIILETGILAGVSLTSLNLESNHMNFDYLVNADFNNSVNFSAGLFFDLVFPRNQRKWSFNNELLFSRFDVKGEYEEFYSTYRSTTTTTELAYSHLRINNMLRFKYLVGRTYLYFNGGISNSFVISEKNYKKDVRTINSIVTIEESKALDEIKKNEFGYIFGVGAKYNKFSFEIRFERSNGISRYIKLKSNTNRFYFLIGYKFK